MIAALLSPERQGVSNCCRRLFQALDKPFNITDIHSWCDMYRLNATGSAMPGASGMEIATPPVATSPRLIAHLRRLTVTPHPDQR